MDAISTSVIQGLSEGSSRYELNRLEERNLLLGYEFWKNIYPPRILNEFLFDRETIDIVRRDL